ncbi:MAG TPA: pseudouridine synthase [Syntrophorhabdaceae bacterium]|jgi:tRNA pseudouridine32 synthase/23S rRNA pseudouridine746 synthase
MKIPLPIIDGIGPSRLKLSGALPRTVMEYLEKRFPHVESAAWQSRMAGGEVVDEAGSPLRPESPCREGSFIFYYREPAEEIPIPFEEGVLYCDDHILAADKPHFLPVMPSGRFLRETLLVRLRKRLRLEHLAPLHRIDRETAGVVIFSHNPETRGRYADLFRTHEVRKVYEAFAPASGAGPFPITRRSRIVPGEPFFRMKEVDGAFNTETRIEVIETTGEMSRYRLMPVTGRKHQLRVHLAGLGIPMIHDRLYPELRAREAYDFSLPLKLLAKEISFRDPITGLRRSFESGRDIFPGD